MRMINMSGQTYGELTILSCAVRNRRGKILWHYRCSCGNEGNAYGYDIRNGHTKTCGRCNSNTYEYLDDYGIISVTLANGVTFIADNDDENLIKRYKWFIGGNGYVVTNVNGKRKYLHKMIMGMDGSTIVDHIDRCKLDNRRINLRIANKSLNAANAKLRCDNFITGHKNIKFNKRYNNYTVRVMRDGVTHYGGTYKYLCDAITAANSKRKELFGEFAYFDSYIEFLLGEKTENLEAAVGCRFGEMKELEG